TTTLVGTLMNLRTGMAASVFSTLNGQAPFGADVISRISHGMNGPEAIQELQDAVVGTMNAVLDELYRETGVSPQQTSEAVDVGTNGEIVLGSAQRALATAAPAGPAFEGSQIKCGMRATVGAIEGVQLGDRVELQIIGGDVPAEGICGSGLVDAVAQLLLAGLLDYSGRFKKPEDVPDHPLHNRLIDVDGMRAFLLA